MRRLAFLDWMRGLAVVVMIQCHTFNSFTRMDLRTGGVYLFSQFVGGMAAPMFLFMAGMTLAFQMESLWRREPRAFLRWTGALKRALYVWGIAYAFRITNWLGNWPNGNPAEMTKVDILNCMGLAMAVLTALVFVPPRLRAHVAAGVGLAIAAASPLAANLDWGRAPRWVHEYLAPGPWRGRFAFFPCASYVAFGLGLGTIVKRAPAGGFERLMQWSVPIGFVLVFTGRYVSNLPYSIYERSNFWTDSPNLIVIRLGIILLLLAAAWLWTEHGARPGWSWIQALGQTSLMAYWVHVLLVYGEASWSLRRALDIPQTVVATVAVTGLMVGLAAAKLRWHSRKARALVQAEAGS